MINRSIEPKIIELSSKFPVVFLTGPRQSGKTTLCRKAFKDFKYYSFEDIDIRQNASRDPRGFLSEIASAKGAVFDEAQRVPEIFSYLQTHIDEKKLPPLILTGSQQFHLSSRINQSLAGRVAILNLFGFSMPEINGRESVKPSDVLSEGSAAPAAMDLYETLFRGLYPPVYDRQLEPRDWFNGYVRTYIERDVRELLNIGDVETFSRFLMLCAGRSGQILNLSSLAADCGVSHTTAKRWISVLEVSGILFLLRPYYRNFSKRLIKSPKLYMTDSGLMCFLLGIRSAGDLKAHPLIGSIFETFAVCEFHKLFYNAGEKPPLYFWRDRTGYEVDLILDMGARQIPVEFKLSQTIYSEAFKNLKYYMQLSKNEKGLMVYGGENALERENVFLRPWFYY